MKKREFSLLLTLLVLLSLTVSAFADHYTGKDGWRVSYTKDGKMESNFKTSDYNDQVAGLQPGDDITFTVSLANDNSNDTDWYMTNKVLRSLEDSSPASGGAYTYILSYTDPDGKATDLFRSDTVGGEAENPGGTGLHQADGALENYFYLDTLKAGKAGKITLTILLDGETQGNDYQNTLANLQMGFAVESKAPSKAGSPIVKTGDEANLLPYFMAMALSGLLLLIVLILLLKKRRKEEGEKDA